MAPPDESDSLAVLAFRMHTVEKSIDDMRTEMRGGFAGLSFVGREAYDLGRKSDREYAEETRRIAEQARTMTLWTLGFIITVAGILLVIIKAVAG